MDFGAPGHKEPRTRQPTVVCGGQEPVNSRLRIPRRWLTDDSFRAMEWTILLVLVLSVGWWLLRHSATPTIPPKPKIDPRKLLAAQLIEAAKVARERGQLNEAQLLTYKASWLLLEPPLGQDEPPTEWNANDMRHLRLVDAVRSRYGDFLSAADHPYAECRYRPAGLLPYPKSVIAGALRLLVDLASGTVKSVHVEPGTLTDDVVQTVKQGIGMLDRFIDVPPDQLPTDPKQNAAVGKAPPAQR